MAQVIAGNTVTEVTKTSAKVGCTKVTREEVETLLKSMDVAKPAYSGAFEIFDAHTADKYKDQWVNFVMRGMQGSGGWFTESDRSDPDPRPNKWNHQYLEMMIQTETAIQLFKYLAERLGYIAYKKDS